jgi:hypothetical protein
LYDVFWWCSAMARMDTRDARNSLRERYPSGGTTSTRSMVSPEETTTFNLVRRLAYWQLRLGGGVAATLHSKALEGGLAGRRPPSGADLELAVEVASGAWVDLLLQAKRIFEHQPGPDGAYDGWKTTQVEDLRSWAAHYGGRTPGMLLYNAEIPPFGAPRHTMTLGGCCTSPLQCHGWRWPRWTPPDRRSPLGITLVVLPDYGTPLMPQLSGDAPTANVVNQYASPLECIFCPNRLVHDESDSRVSAIKLKREIPEWAADLLTAVTEEQTDATQTRPLPDDAELWHASYSLVLPYVEDVSLDER